MKAKKKMAKVWSTATYSIGDVNNPDVKLRRQNRLNELAGETGYSSASALISALGDGVLYPFSLGDSRDTARRLASLDKLASAKSLTKDQLIRDIADGIIDLS